VDFSDLSGLVNVMQALEEADAAGQNIRMLYTFNS
jgi:hypothetical protein